MYSSYILTPFYYLFRALQYVQLAKVSSVAWEKEKKKKEKTHRRHKGSPTEYSSKFQLDPTTFR